MAAPKSSHNRNQQARRATPSRPIPHTPQLAQEVVDPAWLAKAFGVTILVATLCAWLVLCLLYYQGSWQLVLHPSRTVDRAPASVGVAFEEVRFDAGETGQPRLTGWWLPAGSASIASQPVLENTPRYAADTVLFLHNGSGSLSATLPAILRLHSAGINVFAFDYRGFGASDSSGHPSSASMMADASAALVYLVSTRHIPVSHIVPFGDGLGASLAVRLALEHPELPAVILDNPDADPTATAVAAHRSKIVPIRLLYHEDFNVAARLAELAAPKLLLVDMPAGGKDDTYRAVVELYKRARSPWYVADLPAGSDAAFQTALSRFLDQYLPADR